MQNWPQWIVILILASRITFCLIQIGSRAPIKPTPVSVHFFFTMFLMWLLIKGGFFQPIGY